MNINISSSIYTGTYQKQSPVRKTQSAVSFGDMMKTAATDRIAVSNSPDLEKVYDQLSPASKNILERMKRGRNDISQKEWSAFCGELKNLGAISEDDFYYTRAEFQMIPLGEFRPDGTFIMYDNIPIPGGLRDPHPNSTMQKVWGSEDWSGDPFQYLNTWLSRMLDWRSELSVATNPDGSKKYHSLSPITDQIHSYQKVMDIVKDLMHVK